MTGLLASVASLAEAQIVAACNVDIVDLKNPPAGALGALPLDTVRTIVDQYSGQIPLSATIGDQPMQADVIGSAVADMAATGVDFVKLGFFPDGPWQPVLDHLHPLTARGIRLVAVFFADYPLPADCLASVAQAGFTGAMLDTADKQAGSLTALRDIGFLRTFAAEARRLGLLCGLAGSLRYEDIDTLRPLGVDYLGFRGALCGGLRTATLDREAVLRLEQHIHKPLPPDCCEIRHAVPPDPLGLIQT